MELLLVGTGASTLRKMNMRSTAALPSVRERILETALDEFYASGFYGATMRNIANSAGCSAANVYNHFENKSELLVEILRRASDEQFTATRNALRKAGDDPAERWRVAVVAHALFTARNPRACLVANTELRYLDDLNRRRVVGSRDAQEQLFVEIAENGVEQVYSSSRGASGGHGSVDDVLGDPLVVPSGRAADRAGGCRRLRPLRAQPGGIPESLSPGVTSDGCHGLLGEQALMTYSGP